MRALDRKLLRDMRRLGGQAFTIALVLASGVAVFISSLSAYQSLVTSQRSFYAQSRFADVFVGLKRAPLSVAARMAEIPGVAQVEPRLVYDVTIDVAGVAFPVSGRMIAPATGAALRINRLAILRGHGFDGANLYETMVTQGFAEANGLNPGDKVSALLNGRRQVFSIVGIVASPEYVFAVGPGEPLPDDKRFGVFYVQHDALAHAFAMEGAFNDASLLAGPGADLRAIESRLDSLLEPWGGLVAHDRSLQPSHRFLQDEMRQQGTMAATLPPVFLLVSAFLLHVVMGRLVTTQRQQIAALKALGYDREITVHYAKFAVLIVAPGVILGIVLGIAFGRLMLLSYQPFFRFPELVYDLPLWAPAAAAAVAAAGGLSGAVGAVRAVARLHPAEAMRPAAPTAYARRATAKPSRLPARWKMAAREAGEHPFRVALTVAGVAAAAPLVLMSLFWTDALDYVVDVQFAAAERADAVVQFVEPLPGRVVEEVLRMPGVRLAEPLRFAPVRLRAANREYQTSLTGVSDDLRLRRLLDQDLRPVAAPPEGVLLSRRLAERLDLHAGDTIGVEFLDGRRIKADVALAGVVNDLIGLSAYMNRGALDRLLQEDGEVSAVAVRLDGARMLDFYAAAKQTPKIATVSLRERSIRNFRDSTGAVVLLLAGVFTAFSVTIALGVVYNNLRIALQERAFELATLRILGFTQIEAARIFFAEILAEVLIAIPAGLVAGHYFVRLLLYAFRTEMFEIPPVIAPHSYAATGALLAGAVLASAAWVARQLWRQDLVSVLKGRE